VTNILTTTISLKVLRRRTNLYASIRFLDLPNSKIWRKIKRNGSAFALQKSTRKG